MTDLLIRDLDPDAHRELKRRAELAGQSLQAYVAGLLESHAGRPDRAEWFRRLRELGPVEGVSGSDAVAAACDDLDPSLPRGTLPMIVGSVTGVVCS